eukprot:Phypoly_transcript_02875.p1 GENE.Phypoly_transcript_02875~~Phypoly_transcript_02875.p1  ORF type:complete len:834 (-),score=168.92 Phypoly_transcript_02875:78-2579(-)
MSEGIELEERVPLTKPVNNENMGRVFHSPAVAIATFLFAAAQNEIGMVQSLLDEETVRVNDCDYDKRTALHVAASEGHIDVVRILIREGADLNFADRYNATPLDDAIHHGHQDVAKLLVESGAKHGVGSNFGLDLVHAAGHGDLKNVIKLVENGIPINSCDYDLRTPLHLAIAGRHEQVVKYLLEHGADITAEDRYGGTPLEEAHRAGVRLGEDPILNLVMGASGAQERLSWRISFTNPFVLTFVTIEIVIGILFALFAKYGDGASSGQPLDTGLTVITQRHPFFMDVHVMIFIGFGFLMTFLRKYGYTAVGLTFIIGSLAIQVYQLSSTFWQNVLSKSDDWQEVEITVEKLIMGDFAAGAVLISFGALLGKVTFTQMLLLTIFEVFFYSLNEAISLKMEIADIGGSMVIHVFGAFFGLAASKVLTPKSARGNRDNAAVYHADIFSMIGTVFLWIFWPSFNAALSEGNNQHRAVINTVLSLTASCIFAFIFSQFWRREKLFNMVDIQNATLAGGVAMGSSADMAIHPAFALLVGAVAGTVSVFGFAILQGLVENHLRLHDTCGVLNLHGIPGVIGGFVSAITTAARGTNYNVQQYDKIYSAAPGRHAQEQAKLQVAFLFITLGVSIGTGFLCATMLSRLAYPKKFFIDSTSFETPSREVPYFFDKRGEARHSSEKSADTPSLAAPGGANPDADRALSELQNKVTYVENSLRSHRRTLREQARMIEGITGQRPSLLRTMTEEESQFMLGSPRGGLQGSSSGSGPHGPHSPHAQQRASQGPSQAGPSQPSLAVMLENLTRQGRQATNEENRKLLQSISQKLDDYISHEKGKNKET